MDGPFYVDSRPPFLAGSAASVTLSTTDKALIPLANIPVLGANYFGWIGKAIRITLFGQLTTGTTPGNGVFSLYWGTGADAVGTILANSPNIALTASMTQSSLRVEMIVRCRAMGTLGSLIASGSIVLLNSATASAAVSEFMVPATQPIGVTVDLTLANVLSPQFRRSGSTAESLQIVDVSYEALN